MTRTTLAVAADYADAMLIARRWKNVLFLVLLFLLLVQIGMFLLVRNYTSAAGGGAVVTANSPSSAAGRDVSGGLEWVINTTDFLVMICVTVLAVVMLLITGIMLVGRLIGVSHLTGAFIRCVLLGALLFPWQSLWNYPIAGTDQTNPAPVENIEVGPRFGVPGALYTWPELRHRAHFSNTPWTAGAVGWARFAGWPAVAILLLFLVQIRSSRGLKLALGETEVETLAARTAGPPAA